jgi:hypothetical protein
VRPFWEERSVIYFCLAPVIGSGTLILKADYPPLSGSDHSRFKSVDRRSVGNYLGYRIGNE